MHLQRNYTRANEYSVWSRRLSSRASGNANLAALGKSDCMGLYYRVVNVIVQQNEAEYFERVNCDNAVVVDLPPLMAYPLAIAVRQSSPLRQLLDNA